MEMSNDGYCYYQNQYSSSFASHHIASRHIASHQTPILTISIPESLALVVRSNAAVKAG